MEHNSLWYSTRRVILGVLIATLGQACATAADSGYAPVHGVKMYYEVHGTGQPLILIHGGLGSSDMFGAIMPDLSRTRQVIAVDLQAHGRTADIDRPMTYQAMADDIAALIHYLKITKADIMGYSVGGEVALRTAIQHPEVVRKLVIVSAAFQRDGWYPEIVAGMSQLNANVAQQMKQTPMYQNYARVAPRPEDWPVLCTKLGAMFREDYDWSNDVPKIQAPVLLAFGDADAVRTAHAVQFFELLGGGKKDGGWDGSGMPNARLAILPGATHYTIFSSPLLVSVVNQFLDAPMPNVK
jgi:pimeloyl-ACP methyl ester carboxylesterase